MKIFLYILLAALIIIIFYVIKGIYKRLILLRMMYGSYHHISQLGNVIAVSGAIRAGKSTLCCGLSHFYTYYIINKLRQRQAELRLILKEIDFNKLDNMIIDIDVSIDNFNDKISQIINNYYVVDDLGDIQLINKLHDHYYNYLIIQDKIKLLKEYVYLYIHLQRESFIFSSVKMYNQITGSYAKEFKNEWIKIKDNYDFPLLEYSVFFEDDKLIYDSNLGYAKRLHEDTGSELFFRLFGHLFRENSFYLTTVQDPRRWMKLEREIAQKHIFVFASQVVGNYPTINKLLNVYEMIIDIIKWVYLKLRKHVDLENANNFFKRRYYKIMQVRKKLFANAFVYFHTGVYTDIDDVGKQIAEDDNHNYYYDFVVPVRYAYGNLNTHEFYVLYDYLYNKSGKKYSDLGKKIVDEDEILNILQKVNEKNTTGQAAPVDNSVDIF